MFYFRINKLRLKDNRESGFWPWQSGLAEIRFVSLVTTGDSNFPDLEPLMAATERTEQRKHFKAIVKRVVSARQLLTVDNVKDGHEFTFGDEGYVLYQANNIPDDLHLCFLAIEDDGDVRNTGSIVSAVVKDDGFDDFLSNLLVALGTATNPALLAGIAAAKYATHVISQNLKNNEDDQAGLLYMSLNRQEHYRHGERKKDNVPDLTGNMFLDY